MSIKAGEYVIVRCTDAGVHAGVLVSHDSRTVELTESRRLWYWKVANGGAFLSGIAVYGLHPDSKVGAPVDILLTESCEIIRVDRDAIASIRDAESFKP